MLFLLLCFITVKTAISSEPSDIAAVELWLPFPSGAAERRARQKAQEPTVHVLPVVRV